MRIITKLGLVALATTALLSLAVVTASARRFELSERNFLVSWEELRFSDHANPPHVAICPVTLDGSFHSRTLSKVCGQLIGYVNRAIVGGCAAGAATALTTTLPWHILYVSFTGTLPIIETIRIKLIGASFQVEAEGLRCLTATSHANPAEADVIVNHEAGASKGKVEGLTALPEFTIPLTGEFGLCNLVSPGHFEGTGTVTSSAGTRPPITVRLVQ